VAKTKITTELTKSSKKKAVSSEDKVKELYAKKEAELKDLPGIWFAVHSYAGHENQVMQALHARIRTQEVEDEIFEIITPTEKAEVTRAGKTKVVEKVRIPGFILVRMVGNDEEGWDRAWSTVRQTPGVTGFLGQADQPIPLTLQEVLNMVMPGLLQEFGEDERKTDEEITKSRVGSTSFSEGEPVRVVGGPFEGNEATVSSIDQERHRVVVMVSIFGRETPVDLDFTQVVKMDV
jgi:transcriptional antiterminator NusG